MKRLSALIAGMIVLASCSMKIEASYSSQGTLIGICEWANNAITYTPDMEVHGVYEYWQTPEETVARGTGDCEDFSLLIGGDAILAGYDINLAVFVRSDGKFHMAVEYGGEYYGQRGVQDLSMFELILRLDYYDALGLCAEYQSVEKMCAARGVMVTK
jgi:hypothetical protein